MIIMWKWMRKRGNGCYRESRKRGMNQAKNGCEILSLFVNCKYNMKWESTLGLENDDTMWISFNMSLCHKIPTNMSLHFTLWKFQLFLLIIGVKLIYIKL
jgi:hypothetical protein